jgi:ferrous iron transport protein B
MTAASLASGAAECEVALVGCPNCGKTALFNALTGSRQKVANYAGVTVERKEGSFATRGGRRVRLLDLPGTYSLRARSPDEAITRDVVLGRRRDQAESPPDLLVCVADATNLGGVLRLVLELKRTGRPILVSLNMIDIARRQGTQIDVDRLAAELGVPVVTSVAVRRGGTAELLDAIDRLGEAGALAPLDKGAPAGWAEPDTAEIRALHREAERILRACSFRPGDDRWTVRIDRVLLHPVAGSIILLAVLFLMFQAVFAWAQPPMDAIKAAFDWLKEAILASPLPGGWLKSLLANGVVSGVASVLVFLPQIVILFFFILLLEDFGYMARAAFLMDRVMGGAGLHGRAFIPLLSSFACAIPGVMATRVIDSRRDRLATILVAPLMTCSARIPVYTLIIAAFIPAEATVLGGRVGLQGLVMFGLYALGIVAALTVSAVLKRLVWRDPPEPFLMELPSYKAPRPRNVLIGLWQRTSMFLKRAGTTILSLMILIWFLSSYPAPPPGAAGPAIDHSIAGMIGHWLEPALAPIGFNWQIAAALIPGLAAREVMVGALGTIYAVAGADDDAAGALTGILAAQWSVATALALLAWYVFAPQCASTLAVIRRETNSWRWPLVTFLYMLALAYGAAFVVFHAASAFAGG